MVFEDLQIQNQIVYQQLDTLLNILLTDTRQDLLKSLEEIGR